MGIKCYCCLLNLLLWVQTSLLARTLQHGVDTAPFLGIMLHDEQQCHLCALIEWVPLWQVVDCRRILKWTYTYGYYIFGEQSDQSTSAVPKDVLAHHQEFFEFNQVGGIRSLPVSPHSCAQPINPGTSLQRPWPLLQDAACCSGLGGQSSRPALELPSDRVLGWEQGQAESYLEKLHGMAEKQLAEVLDTLRPHDATPFDPPQLNRPEWPKFRETLIGLTDVTRTHFRKLVEV